MKIQKFTTWEIAAYALLFGTLALSLTLIAPPEALLQFTKLETYAAIGAVIAALEFLILRVLPKRILKLERALYALFLGSMPLLYFGAALLAGANLTDLIIEFLGVIIFIGLAVWGYFKSFTVLAVGIIAHGVGWDLWHHAPAQQSFIASWYPLTCLLIDVALGLLALAQIRTHEPPKNP